MSHFSNPHTHMTSYFQKAVWLQLCKNQTFHALHSVVTTLKTPFFCRTKTEIGRFLGVKMTRVFPPDKDGTCPSVHLGRRMAICINNLYVCGIKLQMSESSEIAVLESRTWTTQKIPLPNIWWSPTKMWKNACKAQHTYNRRLSLN